MGFEPTWASTRCLSKTVPWTARRTLHVSRETEERVGFEPTGPVTEPTGLASQRLSPLAPSLRSAPGGIRTLTLSRASGPEPGASAVPPPGHVKGFSESPEAARPQVTPPTLPWSPRALGRDRTVSLPLTRRTFCRVELRGHAVRPVTDHEWPREGLTPPAGPSSKLGCLDSNQEPSGSEPDATAS